MAGHYQWSKVSRFNGALDQNRSKHFSKLAKEIFAAARRGDGHLEGHLHLRSVRPAAHAQSVPGDILAYPSHCGTGHGPKDRAAEKLAVIRLPDRLQDNDDVQNVSIHFDAPEAVLAKISG